MVSSHNDLNYNNNLFDGRKFWIIDWEAEFRQKIDTGKVQLATPSGQLLFAKVMLNESLRKMQSPRFEQALALM